MERVRLGSDAERRGVLFPKWTSTDLSVRKLVPAAASGALAACCEIGLLATSGWLITRTSERPPVFALSIAIGMVQAFALGKGIARYLQRIRVHDASLSLLGNLRPHLYDTLEPLVPGGLKGYASGDVLYGFVSDTELIAEGFAKVMSAAVDITASIIIGAVVACLVEPGLGAVLLAAALGVVVLAFALARVGRTAAANEATARAALAGMVIDTMRSARELVAYGREDLVFQRLEEVRRRSSAAASRAFST